MNDYANVSRFLHSFRKKWNKFSKHWVLMEFRFALTLSIKILRWGSAHFGWWSIMKSACQSFNLSTLCETTKMHNFYQTSFFYIPPKRIFLWTSTPYRQVIESHLFDESEVKICGKAKIVELKKITSRIDSITKFVFFLLAH